MSYVTARELSRAWIQSGPNSARYQNLRKARRKQNREIAKKVGVFFGLWITLIVFFTNFDFNVSTFLVGSLWFLGLGFYTKHTFKKTKEKRIQAATEAATAKWKNEVNSLSAAGKDIYHAFYRLPEANRPKVDIYRVLADLDGAYGLSKVNNHHWRLSGNHISNLACHCTNPNIPCEQMPEYRVLAKEIGGIQQEIDRRENRLRAMAKRDSLNNARSVMDGITLQLRSERELLNAVNKELQERH